MVSKPEFVMGTAEDSGKVQEVTKVTNLDILLIEFKDAEGKTQTRIGFRHSPSKALFLLKDKISGTWVATGANRWLSDSLNRFLDKKGTSSTTSEEGVTQV